MSPSPFNLLKLYFPLIGSAICIFAMLLAESSDQAHLAFNAFGDTLTLEVPIKNIVLIRILLLGFSVSFLGLYIFYDFSSMFPQHMKLDVFYDQVGLEAAIRQFSRAELTRFHIPSDYLPFRQQYVDTLNETIWRFFRISTFFGLPNGIVRSTGHTSFIVKKSSSLTGYHISEARGELLHVLEMPSAASKEFYTFFEKASTGSDYIQPTLSDIYIRHSIVIAPRFKQYLAKDKSAKGVIFRLSVVGITKISIMPWPRISNTVYLADFEEHGFIPIAYAVYREIS